MIKKRYGNQLIFLLIILVLAAFILLFSQSFNASSVSAQSTSVGDDLLESIPTDQIMIKFVESADPARKSPTARATQVNRLSRVAGVQLEMVRPMFDGAYVMRVPERTTPSELTAVTSNLEALPTVIYAEPDLIKQPTGEPMQDLNALLSLLKAPNDPMFGVQWNYQYQTPPGTLEGANLVNAWNITTGNANIVVGIVDTGVLVNHPDLASKVVPGYDFIWDVWSANDGDARDPDPNDSGDWVAAGDCGPGSQPDGSSWHGSHVAGTVAAATDNNVGVAGVNWLAKIQPIRVLGRCGGFTSDIIDGTAWSAGLPVPGVPANPNPAKVVNLSLGGAGPCSTAEQNSFNAIVAAGTTIVIAAGNANHDAALDSPGNCNNVITVAAGTRTGNRAFYSNFGSIVEITAPGGETNVQTNGILSTASTSMTSPAAGTYDYTYYQGTSMAAPHVAGVASLLYGQNPALTPAQILSTLQTSARPFPAGSSCNTGICGAGLLDAFKALEALEPPGVETCTVYPSTDVPMTIPVDSESTITSTLTISHSATITDVDVVSLKGQHTWVNDLTFTLSSPEGTGVVIMENICGDDMANFDLSLDDNAAGTWPCPPVGGGTYQPSNPLAAFNGQSSAGIWTLTVADGFAEDGGSLDGWGLRVCVEGSGPPPESDFYTYLPVILDQT